VDSWRMGYNDLPHSKLNWMTPAAYAVSCPPWRGASPRRARRVFLGVCPYGLTLRDTLEPLPDSHLIQKMRADQGIID